MKQLITFFALAYTITWLIWLPLYAPSLHIPAFTYQHALGGLGPMLGAIITQLIYNKKDFFELFKPVKSFNLTYLLIALFTPFLLLFIAKIIHYVITKEPPTLSAFQSDEFPIFSFFTFFIYNLIAFGIGEEVGWRGFALPRIQQKSNALVSSIIITIFWAIWHWPAFLYRQGYTTMDLPAIAGWFFSLLTGSVLLTWLYNSSKGSLAVVAIFHTTIDIAFTMDTNSPVAMYMGILITIWGLVTIAVFKPRHLSRTGRLKA